MVFSSGRKRRVGELAAFDGGADLDRFEPVFLHHALELGDRRVGVLHRQRRHAAQAVGMLRDHLRDAVVVELRRGEARVRAQVIEKHRRRGG